MTIPSYDKSSVQSILNYAKRLTGKSLSEVVDLPPEIENARNRGDLGSLVERYFFQHLPPNNHEPDFADAGLELKTTGVVKDSRGGFRAKERLVLTMIHYPSIVNESWEDSTFLRKCRLMLILFYLYSKELPVAKRKFVLQPMLYQIPEADLNVIKRDWESIKAKVMNGKAHELSEGDTFYLGACRKGSGGEREALQNQPFSREKARTRAFSFKQSYLNSLIAGHSEGPMLLKEDSGATLEEATLRKLRPFFGMTVEDMRKETGFSSLKASYKSLKPDIIRRILRNDSLENLSGNVEVPELEKAGIEIKTVTLWNNGVPKEHMSFPGFKFMDIVNESWLDSSFCEKIEKKFLLVVFRRDINGIERLVKAGYWNMPYEDRQEAMKVWEETRRRVAIDAKNLPKSSESRVAHVRPKARDGRDKIPTPQGEMHVKQCFWLNREYIGEIVQRL